MSSISAINTSAYPGLAESVTPPQVVSTQQDNSALQTASIQPESQVSNVDLSNYYSEVMPGDLLQSVSENVVQAAHDLDNAMVTALQNGYSVQDAVNIQLAKTAYEANARVAKTTFELAV